MLQAEEKDIFYEWMFLFNHQKNIRPIDTVCYPTHDSEKKILGENIKLSYNNYIDEFYVASKNNVIPVLLKDGSMIFFHYIFDNNGIVIEHHIAFLPYPSEDEPLENILSKIIRIDYEQQGYKPNVHSYTHMHHGKFSSYRFTVENIVYPLEFIAYIMKTNYDYCYPKIMSMIKETHRSTITEEENGYFAFHIKK